MRNPGSPAANDDPSNGAVRDQGSKDRWLGPVGVITDVGDEQDPRAVAKLVMGDVDRPKSPVQCPKVLKAFWLSSFSCLRHFARRFWNQTYNKTKMYKLKLNCGCYYLHRWKYISIPYFKSFASLLERFLLMMIVKYYQLLTSLADKKKLLHSLWK